MDPEQTQNEAPQIAPEPDRPRGGRKPLPRLWSWLWRKPREPEPPSILQIRAEWAEYEMIFNDILNRWSAKLAREAKMEKKRLARTFEPPPEAGPLPAADLKAQLRTRVASMRGFPALRGQDVSENRHEPVPGSPNGKAARPR
jgi:hypothetical protein